MLKTLYSKKNTTIAFNLKKARTEAGINQSQIAKKLSTTQSYISKIESGQIEISAAILKEFSKIYNKPMEDFIK